MQTHFSAAVPVVGSALESAGHNAEATNASTKSENLPIIMVPSISCWLSSCKHLCCVQAQVSNEGPSPSLSPKTSDTAALLSGRQRTPLEALAPVAEYVLMICMDRASRPAVLDGAVDSACTY